MVDTLRKKIAEGGGFGTDADGNPITKVLTTPRKARAKAGTGTPKNAAKRKRDATDAAEENEVAVKVGKKAGGLDIKEEMNGKEDDS